MGLAPTVGGQGRGQHREVLDEDFLEHWELPYGSEVRQCEGVHW